MAEPLSLVASLIAVVQISGSVISCCYEYRKGVKNAPKDLLRVTSEVAGLRNVVERLITLIDDEKMANCTYLSALAEIVTADGPLEFCRQNLESLNMKIELPVNEWKALGRRLTWPLQERDVTKTLASIYRTKSLLETALLVDNTTSIIAIRETTRDIKERVVDLTRSKPLSLETQLQAVLEWLNSPDQSIKHSELRDIRGTQTGVWFLVREEYDSWCRETNSLFWIHGIHGCGKTTLCSTVIDNVVHRQREEQDTAVLYHYFDFGNNMNSSAESFVRSLVAQLVKQGSRFPKALDQLRRREPSNTRYGTRIGTEAELSAILCDSMGELDHIYIIIDALDECVERQKLLSIVQRLLHLKTGKVHVLVTSRSDAGLEEHLTPSITEHILLESSLIEHDIRLYIQEQLHHNPKLRRWPQKVREKIELALMTGFQGMFRWVACQVEVLSRCKTLKQLENALKTPPKDLTDIYRRALESLDPDSYDIVCKVLRLLTVSPRPIRLDEAVDFIAIDIQSGERLVFDPDMRLLDPQDLLTMCSSLISLSRTSTRNKDGAVGREIQELHLSHSSVKDFLVVHFQERSFPPFFENIDSQAYAAECCLVYLLQFRDSWIDERDICEYPMARYAAEFWMRHMQSSETKTTPIGIQLMLDLMDDSLMPFSNWRHLYDPDKPWRGLDFNAISYASPLYYASQSGLEVLVDQLLRRGTKPDKGKGMFGTPLQVAAYNGHLGVAQLLLTAGADPNNECGMSYTPLKAAAIAGHADLVRILIHHGADPNVDTNNSGTALLEATRTRNPEITKLLIDAKADVNNLDSRYVARTDGPNPLQIASRNLDLDIVSQLLLKASLRTIAAALPSAAWTRSRKLLELYGAYDPDGVLHYAAKFGWNDMVTSLLQNDAASTSTVDLESSHGNSQPSALVTASREGHLSIVEGLISAGADVNARSDRRYALESAAGNGFGSIVSLLLKNGTQVNAYGLDGTALQQASYHGYISIVTELLDHGADPDLVDGSYGGPLQAAILAGHHQIAQLLLNRGANINAQPGNVWYISGVRLSSTALAAGTHLADHDMIDLLLSKGARVDLEHDMYPPALYVAAEVGNAALVPRLLSSGAELEAQFRGKPPLYAAVNEGHLAATRQLLESGANANHCVFDYSHRTTLLDAAIEQGDDEILRLLIDFGADVNAVSESATWPEPPLHRATEKGRLSMVRILLERGANCNWRGSDSMGWTASHVAARGHPDILRLLCDNHLVDLNLRLSNGSLPMHSAAWSGSVECIEILLARNVDINVRNNFGRTPLHWAAEQGHFDAVVVLLRHGARIDAKEEENHMTPLDHAKMQLGKLSDRGDFQRIIDALEQRALQLGA